MTYTIELDSKPDRNGLTAVMIRLYAPGQKLARIGTAVKIDKASAHWALSDKRTKKTFRWGKWVIRHPDADALNARIEAEYNRIKTLVESWLAEDLRLNPERSVSVLTPSDAADRYKNRLSDSYFDLAGRVLEEAKLGAFRTYSLKQTAVNAFAKFTGDDLSLQAVTAPLLEKFQKHLKNLTSERTGKKLKPSSVNQYLESLAKIHKDILRLKGHSARKAALLSPFADVDPLPAKSTFRSKFDEQQIETIRVTAVESNRRRVLPTEAFSVWMLAHFLAGARCSDVLLWRYQNFEVDSSGQPVHLTYTMLKTGNVVSIPVHEEAQSLLARWWKPEAAPTDYVLPYLDNNEPYARYLTRDELYAAPFEERKKFDTHRSYWNGQLNQVLKEIQGQTQIKGTLRMHNARHSFADLARRIMETDKSLNPLDITLMLGQSDFKMTLKYLEEMGKQDATKPMQVVFGRKKQNSPAV